MGPRSSGMMWEWLDFCVTADEPQKTAIASDLFQDTAASNMLSWIAIALVWTNEQIGLEFGECMEKCTEKKFWLM